MRHLREWVIVGGFLVGIAVGLAVGVVQPTEILRSKISWGDLEGLLRQHHVAVAGPADATPDELVRTILADDKLPRSVREPFVALARAKAPSLLPEAGRPVQEAHVTAP